MHFLFERYHQKCNCSEMKQKGAIRMYVEALVPSTYSLLRFHFKNTIKAVWHLR